MYFAHSRPLHDAISAGKEWGRSSLALLDVRSEALRLSAEVVQLRLYGVGGLGRDGPVHDGGSKAWKGDRTALQALREMEEKVWTVVVILRVVFFLLSGVLQVSWRCILLC